MKRSISVCLDDLTFTDYDIYLFKEGSHTKLYKKLGAHIVEKDGRKGVYFAVWAPNSPFVSVVGDFNGYNKDANPLKKDKNSGIWSGFVENAKIYQTYKFHIETPFGAYNLKADPFAFFSEKPPKSASVIYDLSGFEWEDGEWLKKRSQNFDKPMSIYEVHLGSWKRKSYGIYLNYKELAYELVEYMKKMGFTHVELLPITEHPYDGSWGYQSTGYFSPTARFGEPKDFMAFVNIMHKNGFGVIMDWVPSHFAVDGHGLIAFDGTALYEYEDPRLGYHPEWKSSVFDYSKGEVRSFLLSSAHFWFDMYHIDGLRVDAVASMIYRDYARKEWIPNRFGGRENLEAIDFLKKLNESCYRDFKGITMIAEESTAFPKVTWPVDKDGLGFGYKWNMGWMHDTLEYFKVDPVFRKYHHHQITFSFVYAFSENYILPLSHDEVVHMKGSLINKMPGDIERKFANLRALFGFMFAHPGKKLLFMGDEIAQYGEWNFASEVDWQVLENPLNKGVQELLKTLNSIYKSEKALWLDCNSSGFELLYDHAEQNIVIFKRKNGDEEIIVVCNFADFTYNDFEFGVDKNSTYVQIFNSQDPTFGGWGMENDVIETYEKPMHNRKYSIRLDLPPLSVLYLKPVS